MCLDHPRKNIELAQSSELRSLLFLLSEQLLPQWCNQRLTANDTTALNLMHNLVFLFAYKTSQVFQARVIHQIVDQNWDLKGFKCTLVRIFQTINLGGLENMKEIEKSLEKLINGQNLQSTACIKAIGQYLRNSKKSYSEDDLQNPIKTYQTTFDFLQYDIERYRSQGIKYECFQILHPWAYDLDAVDMKYIVNNNLEPQISDSLKASVDAQIFWLSFFKPQLSCSADEFFEGIRQLAEISNLQGYYASHVKQYEEEMVRSNYVISTEEHAQTICTIVDTLISQAKVNPLRQQFKVYPGDFNVNTFNKEQLQTFRISNAPSFSDSDLF